MEALQRPNVLILGAGAVGLSFAGRLARVATVYAACRPVHAGAIRERGLVMEGVWGTGTVEEVNPITGPEEVPAGVDYIIITAKGTDTLAICEEYAGPSGADRWRASRTASETRISSPDTPISSSAEP